MNKLKIYIAGPMRGKKNLNKTSFSDAEHYLTKVSVYDVINPSKTDEESGLTEEELCSRKGLRQAMKRDIDGLCTCDGIYMLNGWEKSEGAKIEHALASMLGMYIMYEG